MTPKRTKLIEAEYDPIEKDLHCSSSLKLKDSLNKLSGSKRK